MIAGLWVCLGLKMGKGTSAGLSGSVGVIGSPSGGFCGSLSVGVCTKGTINWSRHLYIFW